MRGKRAYTFFLHAIFCAALCANIYFWLNTRTILPAWNDVPAAPAPVVAGFTGLGDRQAAFRIFGYVLQNLGNTGGRYQSLADYDYAALKKWFFLQRELNPRSNFTPLIAAYYFGGIDGAPEKSAHVVTYLAAAGHDPYPDKWRWLAQASYMARFKEKNLDRSLDLANQLVAMNIESAPWTRQLPAFIQLDMGNKEAATQIILHILDTERDKIHPNEVNFMIDFVCKRSMEKAEAAKNPLCQSLR